MKTELILGEKHTFNDVANAILAELGLEQTKALMIVLDNLVKEAGSPIISKGYDLND